jgi:hypothetical protein
MKVQYVLHLLLCGLQDDIRLRAIHSVIESDQFLQSLLVFDPSSCSVLQALVERKPHLSQSPTGKVNWVQIWRSRRPGSGPPLRAIHRSGNLIVNVWWRSVMLKNNIWFVLKYQHTKRFYRPSRHLTSLMYSCWKRWNACAQKYFLSCSLQWRAFNLWCFYFLTNKCM